MQERLSMTRAIIIKGRGYGKNEIIETDNAIITTTKNQALSTNLDLNFVRRKYRDIAIINANIIDGK